jgi:hypothetical protein
LVFAEGIRFGFHQDEFRERSERTSKVEMSWRERVTSGLIKGDRVQWLRVEESLSPKEITVVGNHTEKDEFLTLNSFSVL